MWVLAVVVSATGLARADLVRYDHIVVVIEENHSYDQIIGSVNAPNINALADAGVLFTNFYAKTHNSLLVITFDEDNGAQRNKIATVFVGADVNVGTTVATTYTLHNLLRTIEEFNGTASHAGAAANVQPIYGAFTRDASPTIVRFQQGAASYAGTHDTYLDGTAGSQIAHDADTLLITDGSPDNKSLVRFDNIIGTGGVRFPGQPEPCDKLRVLRRDLEHPGLHQWRRKLRVAAGR